MLINKYYKMAPMEIKVEPYPNKMMNRLLVKVSSRNRRWIRVGDKNYIWIVMDVCNVGAVREMK